MSLNPDDSRRRGRSRSPGGRGERDRSQADERRGSTRVQAPSPPSSRYDDDRDRDRDRYEYEERTTTVKSSREDPRYDRDDDRSPPRRPSYAVPGGFSRTEEDDVRVRHSDGREKDYYEEKKYKSEYVPEPAKRRPSRYDDSDPDDRDTAPRRYADRRDRESYSTPGGVKITHGREESPKRRLSPPEESPKRRSSPPAEPESPPVISVGRSRYADPKKWEYAQPEETITYTRKESTTTSSYAPAASSSVAAQIVTVEPGKRRTSGADRRMSSSLTVATTTTAATSLALAPGSPLLEAYRGTYQSISPMPSALMITAGAEVDYDVNTLDISSPSTKRRHARFNDLVADAATLARALRGTKAPDTEPLIEILPALSHEQILDLRVEYKKIVKTGSDKKGVNIAKHIKMRLKEESPSLMKACYATALGRWESEAYWANFWYQGEKSRRELLIESLMGRTNGEIRAIKDGFSDKKYSDSLTKCMRQELKEDKFKKAVMLVLEEKRMQDKPGYPLDRILVETDVRDLHRAVRAEKGGESAMIEIIVIRSDTHLREVLRVYELSFRSNFARDMLKKSGNLVGELLTHILNGVINRPVRDALLVHHALSLTKSDGLRTELLISRLVRYHWDRPHMEAVKREYRARYGKDMQQAVSDGTKGEWGRFCEELCFRRMGDEVRRVEMVEGEYRLAGSVYQ